MQTANKNFYIVLILLIAGLIYLLSPILTPFLIAALLAYLSNPLVEKLTHWRIPRLLAIILVFLFLLFIFSSLILLLIPLIQKQIETLINAIPTLLAWLQTKLLPWLTTNFGVSTEFNLDTIKTTVTENLPKAGSFISWTFKSILHSGVAIIAFFLNLFLIPVVFFYLLRDWNFIVKKLRDLIPRHIEPTAVKIAKECDTVLSAFFRGQFLVMISLGIIYSIGLMAIGLQVGLIIGLISGLVSIVPYLGFLVGIVAASIAAWVQFGTLTGILLVFVVYIIGQILESTVLTPNLVGDRIGLHPVAVIFAVLAGGSLFGFFGVLLALPVAAVIMVWLRFLTEKYRRSHLYKT